MQLRFLYQWITGIMENELVVHRTHEISSVAQCANHSAYGLLCTLSFVGDPSTSLTFSTSNSSVLWSNDFSSSCDLVVWASWLNFDCKPSISSALLTHRKLRLYNCKCFKNMQFKIILVPKWKTWKVKNKNLPTVCASRENSLRLRHLRHSCQYCSLSSNLFVFSWRI